MAKNFDHTRKALEEFDAGVEARCRAWETAQTDADIHAAEDADEQALNKVREAFHLDTHDINSHDNCMRVDLAFMRRMANQSLVTP